MTAPFPHPAAPGSALPTEITGSAHNWWTRYRRYPVFSPDWVRGRMLAWGVGVALWSVTMIVMLLSSDVGWRSAGSALVHMTTSFALPVLLGPLAGGWVLARQWPHRKEGIGLIVALLAVVAACVAVQVWALEPMKEQVARWVGDVGSDGRRTRVHMVLGVTVKKPAPPPAAASAPAGMPQTASGRPDDEDNPDDGSIAQSLPVLASAALITFWLAGGMALWAWRRQHLLLIQLHQRRQLDGARAAQHEAELRLSVLAAQVEPHFLFNTLAGVRSAITSDPLRASDMIDRLVDYLRAAIPRMRADGTLGHSTLGAQLEIVRAYLALMQARMPRLNFTIDVPADLLARRFPPLMLISLAENAVKHGVEPKIGSVSINVTAQAHWEELEVSVADDGVGFGGASSGSGIGLSNAQSRLSALYGERASLALKLNPGGGVIATIRLPLEAA